MSGIPHARVSLRDQTSAAASWPSDRRRANAETHSVRVAHHVDTTERRSRIPGMSERPLRPEEKLRLALDLFGSGVELKRQSLRREHPQLAPPEIERMLREWLSTRPGAEHGDTVGRLRKSEEPAG